MRPASDAASRRLHVNRDSRLAVAISADLRRRIWSGELRPGDRLPANRELAASLGVSLGSVREAISMLIGDGLVETRTTRGTFVCGPGSRGAGDGSALERRE